MVPLKMKIRFIRHFNSFVIIILGLMRWLPLAAAIPCMLTSCNEHSKPLPNEYRLECFPDGGTYFVVDANHDSDRGGVFAGSVEKIGFDTNWILVCVHKNVSMPLKENKGWYALCLKDKEVIGPIPESSLKTNSAWASIKIQDPASVFIDLK